MRNSFINELLLLKKCIVELLLLSTDWKDLTSLIITVWLHFPGEAEKLCVLSLVDDTLYEEGEELRLVLGSPRSESQFGASVGDLNETLVKIKDTADSK